MTYAAGSPITAVDYNTFSTLASGMNEVFADLHPGATTLGALADFGYGQTPALTAVTAGTPILADQWGDLFQTIRKSGLHQGTTTVPPLPVADPIAGDTITAYAGLSGLISTIRTNRHNLAVGQSTLTAGTTYTQGGAATPWFSTITWTCRVDFSSWNNARYFFNSGGYLSLNGSYSVGATAWSTLQGDMSPLVFNWNSSVPSGGVGGSAIGFYNLTTSLQEIYNRPYDGGGGYTGSYLSVSARLVNAAGTDGLLEFVAEMVDGDGSPTSKPGLTSYRFDNLRATGASVAYPGPAVIVTPVGADSGFVAT